MPECVHSGRDFRKEPVDPLTGGVGVPRGKVAGEYSSQRGNGSCATYRQYASGVLAESAEWGGRHYLQMPAVVRAAVACSAQPALARGLAGLGWSSRMMGCSSSRAARARRSA